MQIELYSYCLIKFMFIAGNYFYVLIGEPLKYDPDFKGPIHGKQRYVNCWYKMMPTSYIAGH